MQALALLLVSLWGSPAFADKPGDVNLINCSIFDTKGKLLKHHNAWLCAFFPNGKMLLGDGLTMNFYDEKMNLVWAKDIHAHGNGVYSEEDNTALFQLSIVLPGNLRSDRLEVYDQEGRLIKHFNFTSALATGRRPFDYDRYMLASSVKEEISHVLSFHRIGRNKSTDPSLKAGNYLVVDAFAGILIFDKELKNIIRRISYDDIKQFSIRDLQLTPEGNFFFYNSSHKDEKGRRFTRLEEVDPETNKTVWSYFANPPYALFGEFEGNLQRLPNGNVLFSVVMNELEGKDRVEIPKDVMEPWMEVQGKHQTIEITHAGKVLNRIITEDIDLAGKPNVVRRQNLTEYLRRKKFY